MTILRMWNVLDNSFKEIQKTRFVLNNLFRKSCRLWENVEKYGGTREDTNYDTVWHIRIACWISKATHAQEHARAQTPTRMRARAHRQICNIYCFSTVKLISPKRLSITLQEHCLSCLQLFWGGYLGPRGMR